MSSSRLSSGEACALLLCSTLPLAVGSGCQPFQRAPAEATPPPGVSVEFSPSRPAEYADLDRYGLWFYSGKYGWVWTATTVDLDWKPYRDGRWVRTGEGWTWESPQPWGWITSHHGRWTEDRRYGWVWIPEEDWAPGLAAGPSVTPEALPAPAYPLSPPGASQQAAPGPAPSLAARGASLPPFVVNEP